MELENRNNGSAFKNCYNHPLSLAVCGGVEILFTAFEYVLFCCTKSSRHWPMPLFGCLTYRTPDEKECIFFSSAYPIALLMPCCALGQIFTYDTDEDVVCMEMGPRGMTFCCSISAVTQCLPLPCHPFLMLITCIFRNSIIHHNDILRDVQCGDSVMHPESLRGLCTTCAIMQAHEYLRVQSLRGCTIEERAPILAAEEEEEEEGQEPRSTMINEMLPHHGREQQLSPVPELALYSKPPSEQIMSSDSAVVWGDHMENIRTNYANFVLSEESEVPAEWGETSTCSGFESDADVLDSISDVSHFQDADDD
ncbi:hypothetical protein CYMTET_42641 [Cymbomonas tetramitiformis]|uniref:Uncharacterized protein n=1 Tax=Cymbomonas tetramitiformis TaxID=36881 RepID=A0AAE0C4U1_9CHLO|nr:hypothetical protein CYMTET_42641 [Cymbomonas tetramitiformis]